MTVGGREPSVGMLMKIHFTIYYHIDARVRILREGENLNMSVEHKKRMRLE